MTKGFRHVGRAEIPGGGQVTVQGTHAYVGHLDPPHGTSILDVGDPRHPEVLSTVMIPDYMHSHKVRVHGDVMLVNNEGYGKIHPELRGGLKLYDIADKRNPREIGFFHCAGKGIHRFDYDGDYAYISPTVEGWHGNVAMILDVRDPRQPVEVSRWWMPGQWVAGGETPTWEGTRTRCHHPLRLGNRLYVSYWHGGFGIVDIEDIAKPKTVSILDWSPPYPCPTHTALPIPHSIKGRRILVVTDEEVADRLSPTPNAFLWVVDITEETKPIPIATFRVPHDQPFNRSCWFGAHQPMEQVHGDVLFVTWFAGGLRAVDISDPYAPTEVASYMPQPGRGHSIVQSNDVFFDKATGLIYLIDRLGGLDILEYVG